MLHQEAQSTEPPAPSGAVLVAYDEQAVRLLLRDVTPQELLQRLGAGSFDTTLAAAARDQLAHLLREWSQRALGQVSLRDAFLTDPQRGQQMYDLLCQVHTVARLPLLRDNSCADRDNLIRQQLDITEATELSTDTDHEQRELFFHHVAKHHLSLAYQTTAAPSYPPLTNLESLLPPAPPPYNDSLLTFEQPTGWRRTLALLFVLCGVGVLGIPLLLGQLPIQPAGLSLGLLTLGLLVGIRAGWPGYLGSFLIWLVPNLPHFHYAEPPGALWYAVPLLIIGLILLTCDRYVRALWRWLRRWTVRAVARSGRSS